MGVNCKSCCANKDMPTEMNLSDLKQSYEFSKFYTWELDFLTAGNERLSIRKKITDDTVVKLDATDDIVNLRESL